MKNRSAEIRLTLYSLISALESDLRAVLRNEVLPSHSNLDFINDPDVKTKTIERFAKENPGLTPGTNLDSILEYLDFQESYKIILTNKNVIPSSIIQQIKKIVPKLDTICAIRNRVMHSRPLLIGDFSNVYSFVNELIPEKRIEWAACKKTMAKLEDDPSFVFSLQIPQDTTGEVQVFHNLPTPDFDESGFIGRDKDLEQVKKLLLGNNRVVTLIGDGGVGKSALILKVVYDIIDMDENCPFEAIIWSSAKTTMLTPAGIQQIHNSLRDFSGVIESITYRVGAPIKNNAENIKEILEFLDEFNVLLVIDNLETILEKEIRYFIREAQQKCKIAITSRVGLGELEFPRKIFGLTENESAILIREIAKVRNSDVLMKLSNKQLSEISKQLHYNPLAIKWFLNSVDTGKSPKEVLNNKNDLLNYCLSNVYEKLSTDARLILSTILSARRSLNDAELNFLTDLAPLDMRKALNKLFVTTLVKREIPSENDISECVYTVTDFAKNYLLTQHPPTKSFVQTINKNIKKLASSYEEASLSSNLNEFSFKALEIRNKNERVIARYLHEALRLSRPKIKKYDDAIGRINQAKEIVPNYFEIYRISAFIKSYKGDLLGAEEDYKIALELEPNNVRLLFFYSGFLMYQMDDVSSAVLSAKKAYELRPSSPETAMMYGRCIGYLGKYEEAIKLLKSILNSGNIGSVKSRKIITTIIIDFYRRWANYDVELNGDRKLAINKLENAVKVFEKAEMSSEVDYGMIKDFSEAIQWLIQYSRDIGDEEQKKKAYDIYKKYEIYIEQSPYHSRLNDLLSSNYLSCSIGEGKKRYTGLVIRFQYGRNYAFLNSDVHGELYFNRNTMINKSEWTNIDNDIKLEYSLGSNAQGECATDVVIHSNGIMVVH